MTAVVDRPQVAVGLFAAAPVWLDCPQVAEALFDSLAAWPVGLLVAPMNLIPMSQ